MVTMLFYELGQLLRALGPANTSLARCLLPLAETRAVKLLATFSEKYLPVILL